LECADLSALSSLAQGALCRVTHFVNTRRLGVRRPGAALAARGARKNAVTKKATRVS